MLQIDRIFLQQVAQCIKYIILSNSYLDKTTDDDLVSMSLIKRWSILLISFGWSSSNSFSLLKKVNAPWIGLVKVEIVLDKEYVNKNIRW